MAYDINDILKDPRLVTKTIAGREYHFWYHRAGMQIALDEYGYDILNAGDDIDIEKATLQDTFNIALRQLWVAHLLFERISYETFDLRFLPADGQALANAYSEVMKKQAPSVTPKEDAPEKKPKPKK